MAVCLTWRRIFATAVLAGALCAQQGGDPTSSMPNGPPGNFANSTTRTAKIQTEDGSSLKTAPAVIAKPPQPKESYCVVENVFPDGTIQAEVHLQDRTEHTAAGPSCYLMTVMLPGYRSFSGVIHDGSRITLYRLREHEGPAVSIATVNAPNDARKWYERDRRRC